jgi:hypothetical protein
MLDVSVSYNRFKFLGHEYLTWLWYVIEKDQGTIAKATKDSSTLNLGNRIVFENRRNGVVESVTIKGDEAGLEEGMLALRKGAKVTELNLVLRTGDEDWRFTLKGESLHLVGFKCPKTGHIESSEDVEGAVLEKIYLCEQATQAMDKIFRVFIRLRVSDKWPAMVVPRMKKWIKA